MFIIPVGNNIEQKGLPVVTLGLIAANVVVYLHQFSQFMQSGSHQAGWEGRASSISGCRCNSKAAKELFSLGLEKSEALASDDRFWIGTTASFCYRPDAN